MEYLNEFLNKGISKKKNLEKSLNSKTNKIFSMHISLCPAHPYTYLISRQS